MAPSGWTLFGTSFRSTFGMSRCSVPRLPLDPDLPTWPRKFPQRLSHIWSNLMRRAKTTSWPTRSGFLPAILLLGIVLSAAFASRAVAGDKPKTVLPADLDLVPRNAVGFLHLRAADLWRSDLAKELRYLVDKAGP